MKTDKSSTYSRMKPIAELVINLKKQLRFYLDQRGMSAAQLAKKAEVPKQSLSGWLGGSNPRDVRQIKRVADVLGITVDNLMFGEGPDSQTEQVTSLEGLIGDQWIGGLFEVRLRRVKR
jgi:transcriptional regulator with XRE-family HTH domain